MTASGSPQTYTPATPIWCAGCGHFAVQEALKTALNMLSIPSHRVLVLAGIGCSGTIQNNLGTYGYHALHGRVLPTATGAVLGNPELTVIAAGGDGDGYAIGSGHLIHAFRRNLPFTYILMNNQTYGLTKGQPSPTAEFGSPDGEPPLDGIAMGLSIPGTSFLARGYSGDFTQLTTLVVEAIRHTKNQRGYAFLEVISPCVTYLDAYPRWERDLYDLGADSAYDPTDQSAAFEATLRLREEGRLPTGVVFRRSQPQPETPWHGNVMECEQVADPSRYQALLSDYRLEPEAEEQPARSDPPELYPEDAAVLHSSRKAEQEVGRRRPHPTQQRAEEGGSTMVTTMLAFVIQVVDGEGMPLPGVEVGARFKYPDYPSAWSSTVTDGDGRALFEDDHPQQPTEACIYIADRPCDTLDLSQGTSFTIEL